jgi:ABC-2 type transport system permease protein
VRERLALLLDVYRAQFKVSIALELQYRVAMAIWLMWTVLEPVVFLVVWSTVARSTGGQLGGYRPSDFAGYYLLVMWVNQLTFTWLMWEFEFRIREGLFSPKLLRPVHPIHPDVAENLAYKSLTAIVLVPATALLVWLFTPTVQTTLTDAALFVPALLLAFVLRFVSGWTLALAAFWTTRVTAVNDFFFTLQLFLSGQMVPLSVLPESLQTVTWLLPFRWMVSFPVELGLGRLTGDQIAIGFAMQAVWSVVCLLILRVTWRSAMQRYTAVGA